MEHKNVPPSYFATWILLSGKLGEDKKTAFPEMNMLIDDLYEQVGCAPQDGFPSVNVANLLIEKYDGEITFIEYPFAAGIVYWRVPSSKSIKPVDDVNRKPTIKPNYDAVYDVWTQAARCYENF